jgi:hypothetical protein
MVFFRDGLINTTVLIYASDNAYAAVPIARCETKDSSRAIFLRFLNSQIIPDMVGGTEASPQGLMRYPTRK